MDGRALRARGNDRTRRRRAPSLRVYELIAKRILEAAKWRVRPIRSGTLAMGRQGTGTTRRRVLTTISGHLFGQEVPEGLFPLFGCLGHALKKHGRAFYWRRLTGIINFPPPGLLGSPSPLHDKRIVRWVKFFTHAACPPPRALSRAVRTCSQQKPRLSAGAKLVFQNSGKYNSTAHADLRLCDRLYKKSKAARTEAP
jgi:hypothetical protein